MYGVKLRPRKYQLEALKWALSREGAVVSLPTGTGKTLIAVMWVNHLLSRGEVKKVIVLEPTRILVEQVANYFSKVSDIQAKAIHGMYSKEKRKPLWREAKVAVATPETALSDIDEIIESGYDAVVIDECHHTTGKDAYAEFMRRISGVFKRRLGLSAYIPPSRIPEINKYIGEVREWSWSDPIVKPYVPNWIGEVYEAELNDAEVNVLKHLEELRAKLIGKERALTQTAIRWFVRDGALALKESLSKGTRLAELLGSIKYLLDNPQVRPAHKLPTLIRALEDHEGFNKAIVFVDRVVIARYVVTSLSKYLPTLLICGKTHLRKDVKKLLKEARSERIKVIVSTSAGEEGLDLPEGDLLIVWSNVASPIRFIQRHGRILRATTGFRGPKFVVYIVTPETIDTDSFVDSVEAARKAGIDVPVDNEVLERLWKRSTRIKVLTLIEGRPLPIEWIKELTGMPLNDVKSALNKLMRRGDVVYIYTHLGKVYISSYDLDVLYDEYPEYLTPQNDVYGKAKVYIGSKSRSVVGNYLRMYERLNKLLSRYGRFDRLLLSIQLPLEGGALKLVNLSYSYLIDTKEKLELVLRNAFSCKYFVST